MPVGRHGHHPRGEPHTLTEGLRGIVVLILATAGISAVAWLVAVAFVAMFG